MIRDGTDFQDLIIFMIDGYESRFLALTHDLSEADSGVDGVCNFGVVVEGEFMIRGLLALDEFHPFAH